MPSRPGVGSAQLAVRLEAIYATLAVEDTRSDGLARLQGAFDQALAADPPRIGSAHDLLQLLDEWPVEDNPQAVALRDHLTPRLRRHSRALRDREATARYFARDFEDSVIQRFLADSDEWLLHIHAPGGRGKSMFLKSLLGRRAPRMDIPVAWIESDYVDRLALNTTQPWRLLLAIARQLDPQLPHSPFAAMLGTYGHLRATLHTEALPRQGSAIAAEEADLDDLDLSAATEVPRRFRTELAAALEADPGTRLVVVAVDTVENLEHTDGADLDAVLSALREVRHGGSEDAVGDSGVSGLRVVVSGRYDLGSQTLRGSGFRSVRSPIFHSLHGPHRRRMVGSTTDVRLGREAISLEIAAFSKLETRRYLEELKLKPSVADAVFKRSGGNALKLGLFREYLQGRGAVTAREINSWESAELAYLVIRVVDRISDGLVQWILRWGALLQVLTKDGVDHVIWPALEELVRREPTTTMPRSAGHRTQVATSRGGDCRRRPRSRARGLPRRRGTSFLRYAGTSSWVSTVEDIPDAVLFHSDVREPLRRLLRERGNAVFGDIHRRAYDSWEQVASSARGPERAEALRSMVFHSYELTGNEPERDAHWVGVLEGGTLDRADRAEVASELLDVQGRLLAAERTPPSPYLLGLAHLERAEAVVRDATRSGRSIKETTLSRHAKGITSAVRQVQPRRCAFIPAATLLSIGQVDSAWTALDVTLHMPEPASALGDDSWDLIAEWVRDLTPPVSALDTAELLADLARGTRFLASAGTPLARGLLAAERWTEALEAARRCGSDELDGACARGIGPNRRRPSLGDGAPDPAGRGRAAGPGPSWRPHAGWSPSRDFRTRHRRTHLDAAQGRGLRFAAPERRGKSNPQRGGGGEGPRGGFRGDAPACPFDGGEWRPPAPPLRSCSAARLDALIP